MSLLVKLRQKRESRQLATAIHAIRATQPNHGEATVAKIATVAVANPTNAKTVDVAASWAWLLHFADREPLEVYCNPDATHVGILERYPDALAAEPIPERITSTDAEAAVWPTLTAADDDRRTCDRCANLAGRRCLAAWRGEIEANRDYAPVRDIPRRCEGYAPDADDPDTRPGRERWSQLLEGI